MDEFEKRVMKSQQLILGTLCILLPVLSVGFAAIGRNVPGWYESISATYYTNSKMFMIGLLFSTGIYYWAYKGYDNIDNWVTRFTAVFAFGIVMFPTGGRCVTDDITHIGLFQLPVTVSWIIHTVCAISLYVTFMIQTWRFTKHGAVITDQKKKRNMVYYTCFGLMIVGFLIIIIGVAILDIQVCVLIAEIIFQFAYGSCWLVKAGFIKRLND